MQREGHLNTEWNMKYDFLAPEELCTREASEGPQSLDPQT